MTIYKNSGEVQKKLDDLFDELKTSYPLIFVDEISEDISSLENIIETYPEVESNSSEIEEFISLLNFKSEVQDYNIGWNHDLSLVHQFCREEYVKEIVNESLRNTPSFLVVDWDQTAENFYSPTDYRQVELNGDSYYVAIN